jgi:hypothetical protein
VATAVATVATAAVSAAAAAAATAVPVVPPYVVSGRQDCLNPGVLPPGG